MYLMFYDNRTWSRFDTLEEALEWQSNIGRKGTLYIKHDDALQSLNIVSLYLIRDGLKHIDDLAMSGLGILLKDIIDVAIKQKELNGLTK